MAWCAGVPVEAAEPCGQGPREDAEACPSLLQVHSLHGHLWPVQALREPRLHGPLGGRQEGRQGQTAGECPFLELETGKIVTMTYVLKGQ